MLEAEELFLSHQRPPAAYRPLLVLLAVVVTALISLPSAQAETRTLKIINGTPVPTALPFVARITHVGADGTRLCTGSIVAPSVVLTAAHCAAAAGGFTVDIGRLDLAGTPFQQVGVSEVRVHPGYNPASGQNDAALLILAQPTTAPPLRAATVADSWGYQAGFRAVALGWGRNSLDDPSRMTSWLQSASQTVGDDTSICPLLDSSSRVYDAATMVCGYLPSNTTRLCHGDSGGPLVGVSPGGEIVILGITSWGDSNCSTGPTAYTRVSAVADWINAQIAIPAASPPPAAAAAPASVTPLAVIPADGTAPQLRARASRGKRGTYAKLWFRTSDASGQVAVAVRGKKRVMASWRSASAPVSGGASSYVRWRIPRALTPGMLVFCLTATDSAGNSGEQSCARLQVTR